MRYHGGSVDAAIEQLIADALDTHVSDVDHDAEELRGDVDTLTEKIDKIEESVNGLLQDRSPSGELRDLREKYEALGAEHDELKRQVMETNNALALIATALLSWRDSVMGKAP